MDLFTHKCALGVNVTGLSFQFVLQQRKKFFLINLPVHFYGQENLQFVDEVSFVNIFSFFRLLQFSVDNDLQVHNYFCLFHAYNCLVIMICMFIITFGSFLLPVLP